MSRRDWSKPTVSNNAGQPLTGNPPQLNPTDESMGNVPIEDAQDGQGQFGGVYTTPTGDPSETPVLNEAGNTPSDSDKLDKKMNELPETGNVPTDEPEAFSAAVDMLAHETEPKDDPRIGVVQKVVQDADDGAIIKVNDADLIESAQDAMRTSGKLLHGPRVVGNLRIPAKWQKPR